MSISWNKQHHDQLDWYRQTQFRPRLEGLTDEEYFWEPVTHCWSVRKRGESGAPRTIGAGDYLIDLAEEELDPAPVTTAAWRLAHIIVGCFLMRLDYHFGGPQTCQGSYDAGYESFSYAATAKEFLDQFDGVYAQWSEGVRGLARRDWRNPPASSSTSRSTPWSCTSTAK